MQITELQRAILNQIDKYNRNEFYFLLNFKFYGKSIIYRVYNNDVIKSYFISSDGRLTYYKEIFIPNQSIFTPINNFKRLHKFKNYEN